MKSVAEEDALRKLLTSDEDSEEEKKSDESEKDEAKNKKEAKDEKDAKESKDKKRKKLKKKSKEEKKGECSACLCSGFKFVFFVEMRSLIQS